MGQKKCKRKDCTRLSRHKKDGFCSAHYNEHNGQDPELVIGFSYKGPLGNEPSFRADRKQWRVWHFRNIDRGTKEDASEVEKDYARYSRKMVALRKQFTGYTAGLDIKKEYVEAKDPDWEKVAAQLVEYEQGLKNMSLRQKKATAEIRAKKRDLCEAIEIKCKKSALWVVSKTYVFVLTASTLYVL